MFRRSHFFIPVHDYRPLGQCPPVSSDNDTSRYDPTMKFSQRTWIILLQFIFIVVLKYPTEDSTVVS